MSKLRSRERGYRSQYRSCYNATEQLQLEQIERHACTQTTQSALLYPSCVGLCQIFTDYLFSLHQPIIQLHQPIIQLHQPIINTYYSLFYIYSSEITHLQHKKMGFKSLLLISAAKEHTYSIKINVDLSHFQQQKNTPIYIQHKKLILIAKLAM